MDILHQIMLLCRSGFENECAAEIMQHATARDFAAYIRTKTNSGYVLMVSADGRDTSDLIARWFLRRHTKAAIFNLKLPMKKPYHAVAECKQLIDRTLAKAGIAHELQLKHLYHDREEVTACLRADTP